MLQTVRYFGYARSSIEIVDLKSQTLRPPSSWHVALAPAVFGGMERGGETNCNPNNEVITMSHPHHVTSKSTGENQNRRVSHGDSFVPPWGVQGSLKVGMIPSSSFTTSLIAGRFSASADSALRSRFFRLLRAASRSLPPGPSRFFLGHGGP